MKRTLFRWKVQLVAQGGQGASTREVDFVSYWSPEWEGISAAVASAAAAMATVASRGQTVFQGISATLVEPKPV